MTEVRFYDRADDRELRFAVIITKLFQTVSALCQGRSGVANDASISGEVFQYFENILYFFDMQDVCQCFDCKCFVAMFRQIRKQALL